jgi:hypothetical protein
MSSTTIPGYTYGTSAVAKSPLSDTDFANLLQTVLFSDEDARYLRLAGEVLDDQVEAVLDVWYGFVAGHPHLAYYFGNAQGTLIPEYLTRVRARFGQWIRDTCNRPYDRQWLDYQMEIALRHHTTKKNLTDGVDAVPIISMRYIIGFIYPITATIKPFLANKGHSADEIEKMYQAWFKSITLQATLWTYPFAKPGEF